MASSLPGAVTKRTVSSKLKSAGASDPEQPAAFTAAGESPADRDGYVGALPLYQKLAYAAPGFATSSLSFLISVYATDFFVSMGASLAFISFFTALARSFDIMTDPLMGWYSDKTRTRWGRRRPFMLLGCAFYAVTFTLLFSPPAPQSNSDVNNDAAIWFGVFYTLFYMTDTVSNVPYESLGPELTDAYEERSRLFFCSKLFNMFGMLMAAGGPAIVSFLIRRHGKISTQVDCHTMFMAAPSSSNPPVPPMYLDQGICRNATRCDGPTGEYCFLERHGQQGELLGFAAHNMYYESPLEVIEKTCAAVPDLAAGAASHLYNCAERLASPCNSAVSSGSASPCINFSRFTISALDAERTSFMAVAASFGVYYVLAMLHCVWAVRERQRVGRREEAVPLVPSILRACKNRAFRPMLIAWSLDGLGLSALVTMFPFFIRYIVVSDGSVAQQRGVSMDPQVCMGLSVMGLLLVAMAASPLWLLLASRIGKYKAWMLYNLVSASCLMLLTIPHEGTPVETIAIMMLNGIPVGGNFLSNSILADVIDYDEFLNGSRSEGSFSVFATLIPKFVSIPASALPLAVINLIGFVPPRGSVAQPQGETVRAFIRFTFVLFPFACALLSFAFKAQFPIKTREQCLQISRGIAQHQEGKSATDPLTGHDIGLLKLSPEEEDIVWRYECFSYSCLERLLQSGNADFIVYEMGTFVGIGLSAWVATLAVLIGTSSWIADRQKAIVPICAVILFGASTCYTLVNALRLADARRLKAGAFLQHADLILRLKAAKALGQRAAGRNEGAMHKLLVERLPFLRALLPVLTPVLSLVSGSREGSPERARRRLTKDSRPGSPADQPGAPGHWRIPSAGQPAAGAAAPVQPVQATAAMDGRQQQDQMQAEDSDFSFSRVPLRGAQDRSDAPDA